jgi:uncharacterized protein with PIN domain
MRRLVEPPQSRCHHCKGALRLKSVEPSTETLFGNVEIEVFICANCAHEQAYRVKQDHHGAQTPIRAPSTKTGY